MDRHEHDGADETRDHEAQHDPEVLLGLLDQPGGGEQDDDDEGAEHHGEELGLEDGEAEAAKGGKWQVSCRSAWCRHVRGRTML